MKYKQLILDTKDFEAISLYCSQIVSYQDYAHKNTLDILEQRMDAALVVVLDKVPTDVVTLDSTVTVVSNTKQSATFTLVAPSKENIKNRKISVVSSLGASIVGLAVGDKLRYGLPGSSVTLKIEHVKHRKKRKVVTITSSTRNTSKTMSYALT